MKNHLLTYAIDHLKGAQKAAEALAGDADRNGKLDQATNFYKRADSYVAAIDILTTIQNNL